MFSLLAFLVYLAAFGAPIYLLYRHHAQAWYWHVLASLVGLAFGLVPTPPQWKTAAIDLLFGFATMFPLVWGIGGLLIPRSHPPQPYREHHV